MGQTLWNKVREHKHTQFQHKNNFLLVDNVQIIFYAKNLEVQLYIWYRVMLNMLSNKTSLSTLLKWQTFVFVKSVT